jgi:hypothetical protein
MWVLILRVLAVVLLFLASIGAAVPHVSLGWLGLTLLAASLIPTGRTP